MALLRSRLPLATAVALALALPGALRIFAAPHQVPAPYGLFPRTDCDLTSQYSSETKSTIVQLALTPPGQDGSPSASSLVLRAEYAGTRPDVPPAAISILALPVVNANPNVVRGLELELVIERTNARPIRLFYFGTSWGEFGYIPAGGEISRVIFSLSAAELKALLTADRITGRVMNSSFALTDKELAAMRSFASSIGVRDPQAVSSKR
jgi:hypothetical protein